MINERSEAGSAQATPENLNPFEIAQHQFDTAVRYLPEYSGGLVESLKRPDRLVVVEFPIETESGAVENFVGYRVLHNRLRGPGKGGFAITRTSTPTRCGHSPRG